jgi:hypothetical protein
MVERTLSTVLRLQGDPYRGVDMLSRRNLIFSDYRGERSLPGVKISLTPKTKLQNRKKLPDAMKMLNDPYGGFSGHFSAFGLQFYASLRT